MDEQEKDDDVGRVTGAGQSGESNEHEANQLGAAAEELVEAAKELREAAARQGQPVGKLDKVRVALVRWSAAIAGVAVAAEKVYDLLRHTGLAYQAEPRRRWWRRK